MINKISLFVILFIYMSIFLSLSFVYCKHALQMFQQNRYELYRYSKWLFSKNNIKVTPGLIYAIIVLTVSTLFKKSLMAIMTITLVFTIWLLYKENGKVYIKDLVLTNRVKRQIFVMVLLMLGFTYASTVIFPPEITGIFSIIMPYLMIYPMAVITLPFENMIKKHYENEARQIIADMPSLIKIGITGSYGKTSTKNIVTDIISENLFTLMTPASYNTPMGITRTIREQLKPIHEVFVCEMGADKVGDISYLMDFVKPQYGVVTSIGPQHLNTFHSLENIIVEKMKEIEMLPEDGVGFINLDNEYIADYQIMNTCKVVSVGIDNKKADYVARNIKYSKDGSQFEVTINRRKYAFSTSLLGKHNITNILIGIALGIELGIGIKDIVKNVKKIRQVEHRLEVKKINGFTFIDDAFNSNPVGSKMALDVLAMMPEKRVIVTPGMIDLGAEEARINKEFGAYMKGKADHVVLVGEKQTRAIYEGLKEKKYPEKQITVCANVREAFDYVYGHFSSRDTILLENDLPDAFNV
ncbi:MAG: UDP-N-acetylmuramoyl-tripeptide--D-alanyl-D-alanine ligase [Erysipelotrichaceae bacterium]|nr:UDP-N-acetylmuramoyl-tripeptide--D-alanyl-D-alanine ligase [Erysipelotrichaceae bacterium]